MPELPEVQALVEFLGERSRGREIVSLRLASIAALKTYDPPPDSLVGCEVVDWTRRGKYLCMNLDSACLVIHLARGGWIKWWDNPPSTKPSVGNRGPLALRIGLDGNEGFDVTEMGTEKRLALWAVRDPNEVDGVGSLGPEPLDPTFDVSVLSSILKGHAGTLKNALANQSLIAGIGNAYSDEILHVARMSPFKSAKSLDHADIERLHRSIVRTLTEALGRAQGHAASELKGDKKRNMRVHGRTGERCPECGDVIREVAFATKSLQYCPTCQTGGKPLADRRLSRLIK